MDLAEDSTESPRAGRMMMRAVIVLLVLALVGAAAWALKRLSAADDAPRRQVARIALLPDTPPPPPPPPPKETPPPPRDVPKPMPQAEAPKPAEAAKPADEPIKMEGAAGDGPSAFAAGTVQREYTGGPVSTGASAPATTASVVDRAQERLYAGTARQLLRDALERHLRSDAAQATAEFTLWIERDGAIRRVQLVPTGDTTLDGQLQAALDETQRSLRLPQPPAEMQPMRFRLTVRPQG